MNGIYVEKKEDLVKLVTSFFKNLFTKEESRRQQVDTKMVWPIINHR